MVNARAFKPLPLYSEPQKHTSRDVWSTRNKRKPFSKQKCVLRKCCEVSQKWWVLELSNICHLVQHPWKLTSRDYWSYRNERKPLSKQKCVLRKCCRISQKLWVIELSNLCHCVLHVIKLTSRDYWSSRNEKKNTFSAKTCFEKMQWSMTNMVNARAFKPVPLCSVSLKTN